MKTLNMKELLLFSYFYPPLGGPGIQRPVKLVKYLKDFGWEVDVITVKNIVFHSFDYSMLEENRAKNTFYVPSIDPMSILNRIFSNKKEITKKVYFKTPEKIKKIIRSSFFIDDKIGWLPFALKKAYKLCRNKKYDAVMATMGPYTSGIIAYYVSRKFKIPLIIDYRDHWTLNPFLDFFTPLHKLLSRYWEQKILHFSKMITVVSKTMKDELITVFGNFLNNKIQVIYNGFDETDFINNPNIEEGKNRVKFSYIGNFYRLRPIKYFIKALEELKYENMLPKDIEIIFVGNYYRETIDLLRNNNIRELIIIIPQVEHHNAIRYLMESDILLLFIASKEGKGTITGKLFEYLRTGKEILAMIPPDSEAASILREYNYNYISSMENINTIKLNFLKLYNNVKGNRISKKKIDMKYSRKKQTEQLVQAFKSLGLTG